MVWDNTIEMASDARDSPHIGQAIFQHLTGEHPQYADLMYRTSDNEFIDRPLDAPPTEGRISGKGLGWRSVVGPFRLAGGLFTTYNDVNGYGDSRVSGMEDTLVKSPILRRSQKTEERQIRSGYPGKISGPDEEELDRIIDSPSKLEQLFGSEKTEIEEFTETYFEKAGLSSVLHSPGNDIADTGAYALEYELDNSRSISRVPNRSSGPTNVYVIGSGPDLNGIIESLVSFSDGEYISGEVLEEFTKELFADEDVQRIPSSVLGGDFDPDKPLYKQYTEWEENNWQMSEGSDEFYDRWVEDNSKRGISRLLEQNGNHHDSYEFEEMDC